VWTEKEYAFELDHVQVKNLMVPASAEPLRHGAVVWQGACDELLRIAQGVIDTIDAHRHLRQAKILLLMRYAEKDESAFKTGGRIHLGKAGKANPMARMLSRHGKTPAADFVVWVNAAWLEHIGILYRDEKSNWLFDADQPRRQAVALIDHELSHCGAKIVGKFIAPDNIPLQKKDLGADLIDVREDLTDEDGNVLVRFYKRDGRDYVWCVRKHDVEEFTAVVSRHGAWKSDLKDFCDELVGSEPVLFES
jgi:hypothetical protein